MPAPLHRDAVSYLEQQGLPITTTSLNRTMNLLQQQPNLRPSYSGQGTLDVDVETMKPVQTASIEGRPLPPLQTNSNTNQSFGQAFAAARKKLGAGKTFDWNGKKYTTDYREEVAKKPGQGPAKVTSGDGTHDKFNQDEPEAVDNVNEEAQEDIQQGLAEEDKMFAEMDEKKRNTKRIGGRAGYMDVPMTEEEKSNRDMNSMLDTMLGVGAGGAVAAGAAAAAFGNKEPKNYRSMPMDPTNPAVKGVGSSPDLAGGFEAEKPPVNNVDEMSEMFKEAFPDQTASQLDAIIADDYNFDETERAAAAAAKKGDKATVRKLLPKIPPHKTNKALITILKGLI